MKSLVVIGHHAGSLDCEWPTEASAACLCFANCSLCGTRAESCTLGGERTIQRVKLGKLSGRGRVRLGGLELRGFGEY